MKNKSIRTINTCFKKYHFIEKTDCIELWMEKFSACYDTGHRFQNSYFLFKGNEIERIGPRIVEDIERDL